MKNKQSFSRRNFVKTGMLSAVAATSASSFSSCSTNTSWLDEILLFSNENWNPSDGSAGIFFSQFGYEPGYPERIVIRLPKKENDGPFRLTDEDWIPHSAGWLTGLLRM